MLSKEYCKVVDITIWTWLNFTEFLQHIAHIVKGAEEGGFDCCCSITAHVLYWLLPFSLIETVNLWRSLSQWNQSGVDIFYPCVELSLCIVTAL
jgi:hypothetical protein